MKILSIMSCVGTTLVFASGQPCTAAETMSTSTASPAWSPHAAGDAAHGAQLAASCAGCHGHQGEGLAASGFPRLAGQPGTYLAKQLHDFVTGTRDSAVMAGFARNLSEQDVADVSVYYATLEAPAAAASPAAAPPAKGAMLANLGDARLGVPGCGNCHGPNGRGEPPTAPYLAGQHQAYIAAQLEAWQKGSRHNDSGDQMAGLAKRLSAADIAAVASYFAQQSPPKP
jgi:cytochrome c553